MGDFQSVNGFPRPGLAILDSSGVLDEDFDPGRGANGLIRCAEVIYGLVYLGGDFTEFDGVSAPYFAILDLTGGLLDTFAPGSGPNRPVNSIARAVTPAGMQSRSSFSIILGGEFTQYDGQDVGYLAITEVSGRLHQPAGTSGRLWLDRFQSDLPVNLVATDSSRILVSGGYQPPDQLAKNALLVFSSSQIYRLHYEINGEIRTLAVPKTGLLGYGFQEMDGVISGTFTHFLGVACPGIVIFGFDRSNGSFHEITHTAIPDFPVDGSGIHSIEGLKMPRLGTDLDTGIQFLIGGDFVTNDEQMTRGVIKWRHEENVRALGTDAASFAEPGFEIESGTNGPVYHVSRGNLARVYVAGDFTEVGGREQAYFARLHGPEGSLFPRAPEFLEGYVPNFGEVALRWKWRAGDNFLVEQSTDEGASWSEITRTRRGYLKVTQVAPGPILYRVRRENVNGFSFENPVIRLSANEPVQSLGGQIDESFLPELEIPLVINGADMTAEGDFIVAADWFESDPPSRLLKVSSDGAAIESFPAAGLFDLRDGLSDVAVLPGGGVLVTGRFSTVGGLSSPGVVRLNADGSLDPSFQMEEMPRWGEALGLIDQIGVFSGGEIALRGTFTQIGKRETDGLAYVGRDGSSLPSALLPDSFNNTGVPFVADDDDHLYLAYRGPFGFFVQKGNVLRLQSDGTPDLDFELNYPNADGLVIDRQGRFLVWNSLSVSRPGRLPLARFHPDGSRDRSFQPPLVPNLGTTDLKRVVELNDGRIAIFGNFWTLDDLTVPHVALLYPNGSLDRSFVLANFPPREQYEEWLRISQDTDVFVDLDGGITILGGSEDDRDLPTSRILVGPNPPGYERWRTSWGLEPGETDSDSDGSGDLLEYALGTSPVDASDRPMLKFERSSSGVVVHFPRPDITYQFEGSADLEVWSKDWVQDTVRKDGVAATPVNETIQFLRVRVSRIGP
jgi:hypothetical protein